MKERLSSIVFVLLLLVSTSLFAQQEAFRAGMRAFNRNIFSEAITQFKLAIEQDERNADAWYFIGMSFTYSKQYQEAAYSFQKLEAINPDYDPNFYLEACKAYLELGKFAEAEAVMKKYLVKVPRGSKNMHLQHMGKNRLEYARQSPIVRSQPVSMREPVAVAQINSISSDYMPQVNPTGTRIYFTSIRQGGFDFKDDMAAANDWGEDIYFAELVNGQWSQPELLPAPINSMGDDFGSSFTGDGQTMVYVKCGDTESVGNCDLYITQLDGTTWTQPVNMGNIVNSTSWDSQPTINSDGNRIIFTSAREGGYGGSDLYMTEKNHLGDWGIPQNLGSTVNTPLNDNSPYLAPDGKTLYYATNGHPGFGGSDVFYCVFENGKWSKPINLGAPLNSSGDDTNFSISASGMAYFASSRLDPSNYDIFEIELPDYLKPKPTVVVQGIVSNASSGAPIGAWVMIEDINTGELITINKSNATTGEYLVVLPAGRDYSVSANQDGFFFYSQSFNLPTDANYEEIENNIALEPIEKGTKVVLNNIFFEVGKAELKPISYVELNKAVDLLKNNPGMVIEIGGHTDNVGSDDLNLKLSQERANSVMNYIVLAGIETNRLQAKGYGETQPLEDNATEEGRAANRRTEFIILDF